MKNELAIQVNNLSMIYNKKKGYALKNAFLEVLKGDIHGFIGPNGAGKTTLIKLLIGGIKPISGIIEIFGHPNSSIEAKNLIGYVPEEASFIKGWRETTKNYLLDLAYMNGLSHREGMKRIKTLAQDLEISKWMLSKNPNSFSSGQKKRVLIAQALLSLPKLLVLDEPASNLDPQSRYFVYNLLKKINNKYGVTIFISSHVLAELQQFVTGWTIINKGIILLNESFGLVNLKEQVYEIKCSEHFELLKYLKHFKTESFRKEKKILVYVKNQNEVAELQEVLGKSGLIITSFINNTLNLQRLYEKYTTT